MIAARARNINRKLVKIKSAITLKSSKDIDIKIGAESFV